MSLLLIPRRRDLGAFVCVQPHRMPSGKGHVPLIRVVSDFRLLYLVYYYRYRRKQGYPTLHHHKVAKGPDTITINRPVSLIKILAEQAT